MAQMIFPMALAHLQPGIAASFSQVHFDKARRASRRPQPVPSWEARGWNIGVCYSIFWSAQVYSKVF